MSPIKCIYRLINSINSVNKALYWGLDEYRHFGTSTTTSTSFPGLPCPPPRVSTELCCGGTHRSLCEELQGNIIDVLCCEYEIMINLVFIVIHCSCVVSTCLSENTLIIDGEMSTVGSDAPNRWEEL